MDCPKYAIIKPCLLANGGYLMVEKYSDSDFETLLAKYDYNFKRGDIVNGVVCSYESDGPAR